MDAKTAHSFLIPAASALFPSSYLTPEAQAMMLCIGLQESEFTHRQQLISGSNWWDQPTLIASSYWQFEIHAVQAVIGHYKVGEQAKEVLRIFGYPADPNIVHKAMVYDTLLSAAIARLLLYTYPSRLPFKGEPEEGWKQYIWCWRPGKPFPEKWDFYWHMAWNIVDEFPLK